MNARILRGLVASVVTCVLAISTGSASAIVNGTTVSPAPSWAVAVYANFGPFESNDCSGSLISSEWVLTAGHCVVRSGDLSVYTEEKGWKKYRPSDPTALSEDAPWDTVSKSARVVAVGAANASGASQMGLADLKINPGYKQRFYFETDRAGNLVKYKCDLLDRNKSCRHVVGVSLSHDAALLRLNTPVDNQPVTLAEASDGAAVAYGYGRNKAGSTKIDGRLRKTLANAYSVDVDCDSDTTIMCASTSSSYVDHGDSGGPWTQTRSGVEVQVGISSFGNSTRHFPASVSSMLPWISTTAGLTTGGGTRNVLVVGSGEFGDTAGPTNLTEVLRAAGYDVDLVTADALPTDLSNYSEIWNVSLTALPSEDLDRLISFAKAGGGVYLTGERPCCEDINAASSSVLNALIVTVGGIQVGGLGDPFYATGPLNVNGDAIGGIATTPHTLSTWQSSAPGGLGGAIGSDHVLVEATDSNQTPVAAVWDRPDVVGGGRVVIMMDINWLEPAYWDASTAVDVAENVAFFLSGLSSPPDRPAFAATARTQVSGERAPAARSAAAATP